MPISKKEFLDFIVNMNGDEMDAFLEHGEELLYSEKEVEEMQSKVNFNSDKELLKIMESKVTKK